MYAKEAGNAKKEQTKKGSTLFARAVCTKKRNSETSYRPEGQLISAKPPDCPYSRNFFFWCVPKVRVMGFLFCLPFFAHPCALKKETHRIRTDRRLNRYGHISATFFRPLLGTLFFDFIVLSKYNLAFLLTSKSFAPILRLM